MTDRNRVRASSSYANDAARLPSLPAVRVPDPHLQRFLDAIREHLEVRTGARGDRFERTITMRDMIRWGLLDRATYNGAAVAQPPSSQGSDAVVLHTPSGYRTVSLDAFARSLSNSKILRSILQPLSDPARFDDLSATVKAALVADLRREAASRGADVQRLETRVQTAEESVAMLTTEVTAGLGSAVAGVREVAFATASKTEATAGVVTQITAAIGDPGSFTAAGVTLEQAMFGIASLDEGLYGQYTVKINANGHLAGFGLAVEATGANEATSAFIIAADKFAIVDPSETIADPLNPPTARIPFGVDAVEDVIYINGNVRIGSATGIPIEDIGDGESVIVEWSVNGSTSWHSTFTTGDKYARWKIGTGGAWQGPFKVVGEDGAAGATGDYFSFIFKRSASAPATPTGSTPSGWFDAPPAADGNPLWTSFGKKTAAGVLIGVWNPPVQIEGAAGATGATGARGSRTWYENNAAYTASYTFGGNPAGATSYAAKASNVVATDTGGSPIKGDTLVFTNGSSYTYTIVHNGSSWVTPGVVIDGSLLVTGSVTTTALSTSVSISTAGYAYIAGSSTYTIVDPTSGSGASGTTSVFANGSTGAKFGVVSYTADSAGAGLYGYNSNVSSGRGVAGRGVLGVYGVATASGGSGGYFQSYSGSETAVTAIGKITASGNVESSGVVKAASYLESPYLFLTQTPATGGGTATFPGNNKPGASTSCTWLEIAVAGGAVRYIPCWA